MDHPCENFYVFYDTEDNIICCGTAKELVKRKYFSDVNKVHIKVCRLNQGQGKGSVTVLPLIEKE